MGGLHPSVNAPNSVDGGRTNQLGAASVYCVQYAAFESPAVRISACRDA